MVFFIVDGHKGVSYMRAKERFGHNLKQLMARDGIKGIEISEQLGIKPSSVSRWLSGIQWPDAVYIDHLCQIYGWKVEDMFGPTPGEKADTKEIPLRDAVDVVLKHLGFDRAKLIKSE